MSHAPISPRGIGAVLPETEMSGIPEREKKRKIRFKGFQKQNRSQVERKIESRLNPHAAFKTRLILKPGGERGQAPVPGRDQSRSTADFCSLRSQKYRLMPTRLRDKDLAASP